MRTRHTQLGIKQLNLSRNAWTRFVIFNLKGYVTLLLLPETKMKNETDSTFRISRIPTFVRKQVEDRAGQYFRRTLARAEWFYIVVWVRATAHLSLLLLLTSLILPLSALYCPTERPPGIATAKHALKPPLVPSQWDQRYYPTIILFATYPAQVRANAERKVIAAWSSRDVAIDSRVCRFIHTRTFTSRLITMITRVI